ncbi:kinase-like protein [Rhizodiscina lignyota]|uniref:non-specific serine/threonine protein kinase n=1 Tax=Rhizodiscina lignyota TaxID=1504668 RepID=A0A9P4ILC0_9PEZI|nr:kinase-like protein [Rhizodiscina lignyota]
MPHHTLSSASTASTASNASNATIRPSDHGSRYTEIVTLQRPFPMYPDQSYAALHTQQHRPRHPPHTLRTRSSNPSPYLSYVDGSAGQPDNAASTPSGSRTAGNSPSGSPGLFTPVGSPSRPRSVVDDSAGSYSSPFLHYTQRHVPKETHVADIDVDPISGRKIINQYEIVDELGRGVHGKVKLGRILPGGAYVAIKIVERYSKKRKRLGKSTSHADKIKREIAILKKARHPNIVSLLEVIDDPDRKKVYIVLEFVELGEVSWRTAAKPEIALIEYRRHLREMNGIPETEATAAEEQSILDEARQKREKARRRELRRELRGLMTSPTSESWSFEHFGEESDMDDTNFDALSHISSTTSGSHRSIVHLNGSIDPMQVPPPEPVPTTPEDIQTTDFATITGLTDATEMMKEQLDPFPCVDDLETVTATGLEGTMYGAYDDLARGRTPSIAESMGSRILDDPRHTHVPENFNHVPLLTINQARDFFRDTVLGLEYLHYQGVIHRDIKPANLLQTRDRRVKISDFGVSYLGRERGASANADESESEAADLDEAIELAKTVGTPAFYAPELCQTDSDEPTPPVTQQIDVWALGVTLYCLIYGRVPFYDHNPFALMAKIAEDRVHIPRLRLKAVENGSASRPNSRGRMFSPHGREKRGPFDLEYEDVDDDLFDLLKRLFIKDPRKRINLTEVKHHPWVLTGIRNPYVWLQETDPGRESATKIEVSQKDVADAVVELTWVERTVSTLRKVGNSLGLGRSSSTRARAKSSATDPNASNLSSTASSSSTISQDGRRVSVKPDDSIFSALRASREVEHPLAQSETASPELREGNHYFPSFHKAPGQSEHLDYESGRRGDISRSSRPVLSERANSTNSGSTSSGKTLRQKDITKSLGLGNLGMGNMTFPALPSTPKTLDSPGGSSLGGIFGGTGKRLMKSFGRSRDRGTADREGGGRDASVDRRSIDRLTDTSDDPHAEPSLAFSNTIASGLLKQPDLPQSRSSSANPSPISSRAASVTSPDVPYHRQKGVSRQSSISSVSSARLRPVTASKDPPESLAYHLPSSSSAEEFDRAREESFRRRMVEEQQQQDRPPSSSQNRARSFLGQGACPPSPDDEIFYRRQREEAAARPRSATYDSQTVQHPVHFPPLPPNRLVTSSSSEDHFTSGLSQSTSNPSIPSLILDFASGKKESSMDPPSDSSTIYPQPNSQQPHNESHHEDDDGYAGDGDGDAAVESGDDDSDDSFIEMTRPKGRERVAGVSRSESVNVGEIGRHRARKATGIAKAGRSESNGTMKKIRSRSLSGEEEILKTAHSN